MDVGVALAAFKNDVGRYPENLDELVVTDRRYLVINPPIRDGWGVFIIYRRLDLAGVPFVLYSCGEDGVDDGGEGDDVNFWEIKNSGD